MYQETYKQYNGKKIEAKVINTRTQAIKEEKVNIKLNTNGLDDLQKNQKNHKKN